VFLRELGSVRRRAPGPESVIGIQGRLHERDGPEGPIFYRAGVRWRVPPLTPPDQR
jgi:hypothetical protein